MKQVSYLTMFFLPSTFVAAIFGMNVSIINDSPHSLAYYFYIAVPLTVITVWIMMVQYRRSKRMAAKRSEASMTTVPSFAMRRRKRDTVRLTAGWMIDGVSGCVQWLRGRGRTDTRSGRSRSKSRRSRSSMRGPPATTRSSSAGEPQCRVGRA